ncbi:MAG: hypothetical protein IAE87_19085 [Rhodobacteraceae bacterium]|nr:hypothetical protein [Paracoccaceae bacterium]
MPDLSYPGAPESLIERWNQRRHALGHPPGKALPGLDVDLAALLAARVPADEAPPKGAPAPAAKWHQIRGELAGHTELAALNALLIAHLRKRHFPHHAPALFRRIWVEEGPALLAELSPRWLISSVITFGEHGTTEEERRVGLAMNVFFSLMKLCEYERLSSGLPADEPHTLHRNPALTLPLDMPAFSLLQGGLDVNLLAQLWQMAAAEPVAGPIATHLLGLLNAESRGLFRRLATMRQDLRGRKAARAARTAPPG